MLGMVSSFLMLSKTVRANPSDVSWPNIDVVPLVVGLSSPVHITNAGDGSGRLFVVERKGTIQIVQGSTILGAPFLDIQDRVQSGGEEGLLSVAFPPDYVTKGYFFVYYTNISGDNQVSRFYVSDEANIALSDSEEVILYLDHPVHSNHNGGQLAFGPDGYLYIATGDGGGGGDPDGNAQNPQSLLGKILRIDTNVSLPTSIASQVVYLPLVIRGGEDGPVLHYRIPADNPFVGVTGYRGEIWALGLRNPWRFSFDQETGDLYIGDVGQGSWEEIDFQPASSMGGENYGWNEMEGTHCYLPNCETSGMTLPVFEYPTHVAGSCSVTGGTIYRGGSFSSMVGFYFFADYCNGNISALINNGGIWQSQVLLDTSLNPSSFGVSESGELYITDLSSGEIFQIVEQTP